METLISLLFISLIVMTFVAGWLYFQVVLERIGAIYFHGMMWNKTVYSNHQLKLSEMFVDSLVSGGEDEIKRQEFDKKSALAWEVVGAELPHNFESKFWKPIYSLYTLKQQRIMEWEWDEKLKKANK